MPTVTGQNVFIASDSVNFRTGEVTKANISYNSGSDKLFFSGDMVFQDPTASITGRLEVSHIEVTGAHNPWAGTDSQYAAIYLSDMDRGILGNMGGDYARPLITNGANKITIGSNGTSAIRDINIQPGNGAGSAMSNFNVFSSGVKRMTITRSGTMGFGGGQADNPYQAFVFDADGGRMDLLDGSLKIRYTPNNDAITITASVGGEGRILAYDGDTSTPHPLKIAGDYVRFSTSGAGSHEVMRITADGKVGIGTDDPETKLEIATTMSSSPTTQLYLDVDGSNSVGGGGELIFSTSASAGAKDAFNAIVRGQRSSLNDGSSDLTFLTTHVPTSSTAAARMTIKDDGKVGIGTISPSNALDVVGHFSATSKSFLIDHPTKENKKLQYASLEGPENGVYVRGTTNSTVIELPDYWSELVHEDSITVVLTPIGKKQDLYIKSKSPENVMVGGVEGSYDYVVYGERKDIDKLEIEPLKV